MSVAECCRRIGISEQTYYRWKKRYTGMGVAEVRRLEQLEEENRKLKQLVADLGRAGVRQRMGTVMTQEGRHGRGYGVWRLEVGCAYVFAGRGTSR